MVHVPVLLNEVMKVLGPCPGELFIDGTAGSGGHSRAIKERIGPTGTLLAIDWEKTGENYVDLPEILRSRNLGRADGLLLDLGFSSEQLGVGKGFSFKTDEPLLMTYNPNEKPVKEILAEISESELAEILRKCGEERFAGRIARVIKERLPVTTKQLAEAVVAAVPRSYERGRIHPATRTFQALRIYANRELENLKSVLKRLPEILKPGGRVAIISFHSLEDRIVKNVFRDSSKAGRLKLILKKPITATREEIRVNPKARSAKLRAAILT